MVNTLAVDTFRRMEWPTIRRELEKTHGISLPENFEPRWTDPGSAIYWQELKVRQRQPSYEEGHLTWRLVEVSGGWHPTNPLPANNAWQIAHYLKKGLRLTPPEVKVEPGIQVEAMAEVTPLLEVKAEERQRFVCQRHRRASIGFKTWKAYLRHCEHYEEPVAEEPPEAIKGQRSLFPYYCLLHSKGFATKEEAQRHISQMRRGDRRGSHPRIEELEVKHG